MENKELLGQLSGVEVYVNNDLSFSVEAYVNSATTSDKVSLVCYDCFDKFNRGLVCDLVLKYDVMETDTPHNTKNVFSERLNNVVLVYINRSSSCDGMTETEYVFFK